jgi:hypothetical protein
MHTCSHCHARPGHWVTVKGLLCGRCFARCFSFYVERTATTIMPTLPPSAPHNPL